jgi:hypothetical protein
MLQNALALFNSFIILLLRDTYIHYYIIGFYILIAEYIFILFWSRKRKSSQ